MATIILIIYIAGILGVIIYASKLVRSVDDYFLAGRKLSWWVAGGSIAATAVGGATVIGYPGSYYSIGADWYFMFPAVLLAALFMAFFVARRVRALGRYTLPELLELRYDKSARIVAAVIIIIADTAVICTQILAFAGSLSGFLGISRDAASILGTALFIVTALGGGFIGVAVTDAIQAAVIIAGIIIVSILALAKAGGFGALATLPPQYFEPFTVLPPKVVLGNMLAVMGLILASQSIFFQRLNATKTPADAKKASLLYVLVVCITTGSALPIMGYAARVLFGSGIKPDDVVGMLISEILPTWVGALYIAVIIGAILTTTNSILLSVSMNVVKDIYESIIKKAASDRTLLTLGRVTTVAVGIFAYALTKTMPDIIGAILFAYIMTAVIVVPLYGGLFWRRPGAIAGVLSIVLGGGAALLFHLLKQPWGIHPVIAGYVFGFIGLLLGCVAPPITEDRWQKIHSAKIETISNEKIS
jgi:SSS family solute:Na+ symporter